MIFAVLGGSFLGLVVFNNVIQPPAQVVGSCPSPAYIAGNGCWLRQCNTDQNGQQSCVIIPSGSVLGPLNK